MQDDAATLTLDHTAAMTLVSADSHVTEPPDCYRRHIDPKYRDIAPYHVDDPKKGAVFMVEGLPPIAMAFASSAGIAPKDLVYEGRGFEQMMPGGYDARARLVDMDRDGVAFEMLYPSVGMAIFSLDDYDYKHACFQAYNRWIQEYVAMAPNRLAAAGQSTAQSPASLIRDMHEIKKMGLKSVMMPAEPGEEDYDSAIWDPAWRTAVELNLPLSFHLLVKQEKQTGNALFYGKFRGGKIAQSTRLIRLNQDILSVFLFGGVFDRHPELKIVSVEADAGWAPHYITRLDHAYERHQYWIGGLPLKRKPSDYFKENVYLTFQDDISAFQVAHLINPERLLWASDYPHCDSTWPESQKTVAMMSAGMDPAIVKRIVHDNVVELYDLQLD